MMSVSKRPSRPLCRQPAHEKSQSVWIGFSHIMGFSLLRARGGRNNKPPAMRVSYCFGAYSVSVLGSILYLRILDHSVLVFSPSRLAAPSGPAIFPLAFVMANLICSMMMASSVGKASPFAEESYRSIMLLATEGDFSAMKDCFSALMSL